ncbi:MAG: prolyl oligopeptidase family serine peptidase [Planctomycetota bacterium]|nr:prolyl oligopeptidase family serine peptidase [Planctomycetota bacterium]
MRVAALIIFLVLCGWAGPAAAQEPGVRIGRALAVGPLGKRRRAAFFPDPIAARIADGDLSLPKEGDEVELHDGGKQAWHKPAEIKDGGLYKDPALRGGYLSVVVESEIAGVFLLRGKAHSMVYVNGTPRIGDVYRTGFVVLPVKLEYGTNHLLFSCARGEVQFSLEYTKQEIVFNLRDVTAPDLVRGKPVDAWAAIPVLNCTEQTNPGMTVEVELNKGLLNTTETPPIPPLSVRKIAFRLKGHAGPAGNMEATLRLLAGDKQLATTKVPLRVRHPAQNRKVTFLSKIDGSVQYYGLQPATNDKPGKALILSLHGAGVKAVRQAGSYAPKSWAHVVAPTNRRPFGFDWEDWGRWDALEVLDLATNALSTDPLRTYVVGHSMGGHGAWHLGVTFPGKFAAVGPSAGWISFWSYTGAERYAGASPINKMFLRATSPSDTLRLTRNLTGTGVYILHGAADDNVPVAQARTMKEHLSKFHPGFGYHEEPGKGHWWNKSDEPGVDCVDWPPMMDYLSRRALPAAPREVDFTTAGPGVSPECFWVRVEQQVRPLEPSRVRMRVDPHKRRFVGTTENVARLSLDLAAVAAGKDAVQVTLDGTRVTASTVGKRAHFVKAVHGWRSVASRATGKRADRCGPFKQVFRNRMIFIYGTAGTAEENAWAFAKARYDAETFWYRGNGAVDVRSDRDFAWGGQLDTGRNVILYGNSETNRVWPLLFAEAPIYVRRDTILFGAAYRLSGDVGVLMVLPRRGSDRALVGAVGGTTVKGMRLCDRLPYFVSGVAYPDFTAFNADVLTEGMRGVQVAGYFGNDWSVENGDFAWRKDDD